MITISALHIYPIKSLGGISLKSVFITDRGFEYDRRWMLIDDNNRFISQREFNKMCLFNVEIEKENLKVFLKYDPTNPIFIPLQNENSSTVKVQIWDDVCDAILINQKIDTWFSEQLNTPCRLVYMPDYSKRAVDPKYASTEKINSFSDDFPITLISEASLEDLNDKLEKKIAMNRFRPNMVIRGSHAFQEDELTGFNINEIEFTIAKPLARCPIPTIDQETGEKGKEPLRTLATYRQRNHKIYFGQNLLYNKTGILKVGDSITIHK